MRRMLLGAALFLLGVVTGALATDALHVWSRPMLARSLRIAIQTEQEFLASRAAREDRLVDSLVHRHNAAAAWSGEGFGALDRTFEDFEATRFLPVVLWAIQRQVWRGHPDESPEGCCLYTAVLWHEVALTLEALGLTREARAYRERVASQLPRNAPSTFADLLESERTDHHLAIERFFSRD